MFTKRNLFAVSAFTLLLGATGFAQEKTDPKLPEIFEPNIQIIKSEESESYLGVKLQEVSKENFAEFGLKEVRGAAVTGVVENSPAKQAGLTVGDVIVKFNSEEITSVRKLQRLVNETAPDHTAKMTVFRAGSEKELSAVMGKRTVPQFQNTGILERMYGLPGIPEFPNRPPVVLRPGETPESFRSLLLKITRSPLIGVNLFPLTKQLGEYFGLVGEKGLLITEVIKNSPAGKAGLKAGDVIIEIDGKAVSERDLTIGFLTREKKSVVLTVLKDKIRKTISVQQEEVKEEKKTLQFAPNS